LTYASEHLPYTATAKNVSYHVEALDQWWGDKRLSDVTARNCRAYAKTKTPAAARRDLETLRAAIGYWHREYGPLPSVPVVILPDAPEPRDKWLTRQEADRLIRAAERTEPPQKVHPTRPPYRKPKQRDPLVDLGPHRLCRRSDDAERLWRD